jgi:CheY-like chemotaxis protein
MTARVEAARRPQDAPAKVFAADLPPAPEGARPRPRTTDQGRGRPLTDASARRAVPRVRVLIADDHALFRDALAVVLAANAAVEVVGRASTGREAVELAASLTPDVVLMDVDMPVLDGLEATRLIRADLGSDVKILVLSGSDVPANVARARSAGASAFFRKDSALSELIAAIVAVR